MLSLTSFVLLVVAYSIARFIYAYSFPKRRLSDLGKWAVITGCTDGIGRGYAREIAKQNQVNLMLIGRSAEKLKGLQKEIEDTKGFSHEVKVYVMDFNTTDTAPYEALKKELDKLEIGLLLNSAGISYQGAMYYDQVEPKLLDELINVNLRSAMTMCQLVYKQMIDRQRGAIVVMGSASCVVAEPLLAGYAAVKGGLETFARSLQAECRNRNVLVQCQRPLYVATKMSRIRNASLTVPSPENYAKAGLRLIQGASLSGLFATPTVVSPYWAHYIMLGAIRWIPTVLLERLRLKDQLSRHKAYMKKLEAAAKHN